MTKSQSKKSKTYKSSTRSISPRNLASPAFSIASSTGSISELAEDILKNPNNQPLDTSRETMREVVSRFKPSNVRKIYSKFRNISKTGGKKSKRITIKKKKSRKTLKKPMFKRNKSVK